jgi:hypothetical protein
MKRFESHAIGIDQGDVILFSDFEDDGEMWKGEGPRAARRTIQFSQAFQDLPAVSLQLSMIDMSNDAYIRADLHTEDVTNTGFDIVFRTWGDTRVARIRVAWQAIGRLPSEDTWDL